MKWFGRDPVWFTSLFAALVMFVATFLIPLTSDQQGTLNALAVAVAGGVAAWKVTDGQLALVVALFKAVIALAISFGLHLTPEQQMVIMGVVMAIGSGFVRTQVGAPIPQPTAAASKVIPVPAPRSELE